MLDDIIGALISRGPIGLAVLLLILLYLILKWQKEKDEKFLNLVANHINHSSNVSEKLVGAINLLSELIKRNGHK